MGVRIKKLKPPFLNGQKAISCRPKDRMRPSRISIVNLMAVARHILALVGSPKLWLISIRCFPRYWKSLSVWRKKQFQAPWTVFTGSLRRTAFYCQQACTRHTLSTLWSIHFQNPSFPNARAANNLLHNIIPRSIWRSSLATCEWKVKLVCWIKLEVCQDPKSQEHGRLWTCT